MIAKAVVRYNGQSDLFRNITEGNLYEIISLNNSTNKLSIIGNNGKSNLYNIKYFDLLLAVVVSDEVNKLSLKELIVPLDSNGLSIIKLLYGNNESSFDIDEYIVSNSTRLVNITNEFNYVVLKSGFNISEIAPSNNNVIRIDNTPEFGIVYNNERFLVTYTRGEIKLNKATELWNPLQTSYNVFLDQNTIANNCGEKTFAGLNGVFKIFKYSPEHVKRCLDLSFKLIRRYYTGARFWISCARYCDEGNVDTTHEFMDIIEYLNNELNALPPVINVNSNNPIFTWWGQLSDMKEHHNISGMTIEEVLKKQDEGVFLGNNNDDDD